MQRAASSERRRTLSASAKLFSGSFARWPPKSSPPCAASRTTRKCCGWDAGAGRDTAGGGAAEGVCAPAEMAAVAATRAPREQLRNPVLLRVLIQRIGGQAAQGFGQDVGGARPPHVLSAGCLLRLFEEDRMGSEANLCLTALEPVSWQVSIDGGRQASPAPNLPGARTREALAGDRAQAAHLEPGRKVMVLAIKVMCLAIVDALAGRGIEEFGKLKEDRDRAERARPVESLLDGRRNPLAGPGEHLLRADRGRTEAPGAEWIN